MQQQLLELTEKKTKTIKSMFKGSTNFKLSKTFSLFPQMLPIIKKLNSNSRSHMLIYQMLQKQCQANYHQHFRLWKNVILKSLPKTI